MTRLTSSPGSGDQLTERADKIKLLPSEIYDKKLGGDFDFTENNREQFFPGRQCKTTEAATLERRLRLMLTQHGSKRCQTAQRIVQEL